MTGSSIDSKTADTRGGLSSANYKIQIDYTFTKEAFVPGHAFYRHAILGGKSKNKRIDSEQIAHL